MTLSQELSARHRALGQFFPQSAGMHGQMAGSTIVQQFQRDTVNRAAAKAAVGSFDSGFSAAGDVHPNATLACC